MIRRLKRLEIGIEETILVLLILLNIFDFFEVLPGDIDYLKKIISWIVLSILLYRLSLIDVFFGKKQNKEELSEMFFGIKNRDIDGLILIAYFSLIIKNLIGFAFVAIEDSYYLKPVYFMITSNATIIERVTFYFGGTILILISIYLATKVSIKRPSLMHIIHEEGPPPKKLTSILIRTITIFLVLISFFVIIFSLMMEWLSIAVDIPLLMIGIFFYLLIVIKHAKKFHPTTVAYKLANIGEDFYVKFISLFHYKNTIALGIVGLLVLHSLTDIGMYIIPYITSLKDVLYFSQLGTGHEPFYSLYLGDIVNATLSTKISLAVIYILNIIAIFTFLIAPSYLWYILYYKKAAKLNYPLIALMATSFMVFFAAPAFKIEEIKSKAVIGVDILTQSVANYNPEILSLIALVFFILIALLSNINVRRVLVLEIIVCLYFFTYYIFYYSIHIIKYYIDVVIYLLKINEYFIATIMLLFLTTIILFYTGGYCLFMYEIWKKLIPRLNARRI